MYWDEKLKIFGEDHTFKPLTLADMREEDYFALTNGGVQALPEQDNVGRGILFTNPGKWDHGVQSRGSMVSLITNPNHSLHSISSSQSFACP